jgi:hypothetical protein
MGYINAKEWRMGYIRRIRRAGWGKSEPDMACGGKWEEHQWKT